MIITKLALPRRTILRGIGATLAMPLLDAMVPALSAAPVTKPRLGFFYVPYGMSMPYWNPKTESKNFELSPIWAPLAPYKEYVTAVSGLNNRQAMLGTGGGVHSRNCAAWLTGTLAKST